MNGDARGACDITELSLSPPKKVSHDEEHDALSGLRLFPRCSRSIPVIDETASIPNDQANGTGQKRERKNRFFADKQWNYLIPLRCTRNPDTIRILIKRRWDFRALSFYQRTVNYNIGGHVRPATPATDGLRAATARRRKARVPSGSLPGEDLRLPGL